MIHAFFALDSLANLCPPKLLHWGTHHTVPRLFFQATASLILSILPTETQQQDNSYGGGAIW